MSAADWADDEQERLEEALSLHSSISDVKEKWKAIAKVVGTRNAKACAERFKFCRELALQAQGSKQSEAAIDAARKAEEEAARKDAEEESARKLAEEQAARKHAEEEAARELAEEKARQQAIEEEAARKKKEEFEAARKKAKEDEAMKQKERDKAAAEKAAAEKNAAEKAAAEKQIAEEAAQRAEVEESGEAFEEDEVEKQEAAPLTPAEKMRLEVEANREKLRRRQEEEERQKAKKEAAAKQAEEDRQWAAAKGKTSSGKGDVKGKSQNGKGRKGEGYGEGYNEKGYSSGKGRKGGADEKNSAGGKSKSGKGAAARQVDADSEKPVFSLEDMPALPGTAAAGQVASSPQAVSGSWGNSFGKSRVVKPPPTKQKQAPNFSLEEMPALPTAAAPRTAQANWGKGGPSATPATNKGEAPSRGVAPARGSSSKNAPEDVPDSWDD